MLFLWIILLFILSSSCKPKEISYQINGLLEDVSFQKPLSGATVKLYEKSANNFDFKEVTSVTSDEKGEFVITFPRNRVIEYRIVLSKDNYFESAYSILPSELKPNDAVAREFSLSAWSWVKIHLQNTGEANDTDHFVYKKLEGKSDCEFCCPNGEEHHLYGVIDTTFYCMAEGRSKFSYFYQLQGTSFLGNKEIMTVPMDTVTLETVY